jgi:8-oxo-dGTP diphosphatase
MRSSPHRVIAAVISRDDLFLICRRPLSKRFGGLWEFPGGKCEPGESDSDAIRRELSEELGVEATSVGAEDFAITDPDGDFLLIFRHVWIKGDPVCREHSDLRWVTLREMLHLPLIDGDRKYVEFKLGSVSGTGLGHASERA